MIDKIAHTWQEAASALGVTVAEAMRALREALPARAQYYDDAAAGLAAVDTDLNTSPVIMPVSFGTPSRREIANGYWDRPVVIVFTDGSRAVCPAPDYVPDNDDACAELLDRQHSPGYRGGYISLLYAVPEGTTWELGEPLL